MVIDFGLLMESVFVSMVSLVMDSFFGALLLQAIKMKTINVKLAFMPKSFLLTLVPLPLFSCMSLCFPLINCKLFFTCHWRSIYFVSLNIRHGVTFFIVSYAEEKDGLMVGVKDIDDFKKNSQLSVTFQNVSTIL